MKAHRKIVARLEAQSFRLWLEDLGGKAAGFSMSPIACPIASYLRATAGVPQAYEIRVCQRFVVLMLKRWLNAAIEVPEWTSRFIVLLDGTVAPLTPVPAAHALAVLDAITGQLAEEARGPQA